MKLILTNKNYIILFFIFMLLWGCQNLPDIVSTETPEHEKYSSDDIRYMTVDQPFMMSGDYFREKAQVKPLMKMPKLFSKKNTQIKAKPEFKPALKSNSIISLPVKTGFIFDKKNIPPDITAQIIGMADSAKEQLPVVCASQKSIEEVLAHTKCSSNKDLLCLAGKLGVYPGVRMVILIENIEMPEKMPGKLKVKTAMVDTALNFCYPLMEISFLLKNKQDINSAMAGILHQMFAFAAVKSEIMPWTCRCFSKEKKEWYISAGRVSGLKPGDMLKVVSKGKLIKNPLNLPAGWIPGAQKGVLKITQLFNDDFAVCTLENGTGPEPEDLLIAH